MNPVPQQPIIFNRDVDCNLDIGPFMPLAQNGDVTQFQFDITNCDGEPNLVYNGDFTRAGGTGQGWTITPPSAFILQPYFGNILHIAGTSQGTVSQNIVIADGLLFLLTFTINQTQGQCTVKIGTWSQIFTGPVSGTFSYWIVADSVTTLQLSAKGISDVVWGQVSAFVYNTNLIADLIDISDDSVAVADIPFNIFNGWATFSLDWETQAVADGCYRIEVKDPCNCGRNGLVGLDFITGASGSAIYQYGTGLFTGYWVVDQASWTILNGVALYIGTGVPDTSSILYHNSPLCVGVTYEITFTISGASNAEVRWRCGGQGGATYDTDGIYTDTITCTVDGSLSLIAVSTGVGGVIGVSRVSIVAVGLDPDYVSEDIKFGETIGCQTHLLSICNDSDAMQMGFFGTGFSPNIRLLSAIRRTGYTADRNRYRDDFGRSKVYYGKSVNVSQIAYDGPQYLHDFLSLAVIADHFYIDGEEYEVEADEYPTLSLDDTEDNAGVQLPITPKVQLTMNRRLDSAARGACVTGALGATMKPNGNVFTGGTTPHPPITTTDGEEITIDG